jgi:hypothetical protein
MRSLSRSIKLQQQCQQPCGDVSSRLALSASPRGHLLPSFATVVTVTVPTKLNILPTTTSICGNNGNVVRSIASSIPLCSSSSHYGSTLSPSLVSPSSSSSSSSRSSLPSTSVQQTVSCRRVVVTGIGLVSPLGVGNDHVWKRLINGDIAIASSPSTIPGLADLPSRVCAVVPRGTANEHSFDAKEWVPRDLISVASPFIQFALG